jgi:probable F420-dependent oxidoreductase
LEAARIAERHGIDAVSVSDHPFPKVVPGQAGHHAYDPFVVLALVAGATSRVQLHFSLIVLPYRNPFVVARMLSTLDIASAGRVIAGIGAGYLREEFAALGMPYDGRGARVEESVLAMKAAWTGEPVTMTSDLWRADGNSMEPVPFTRPHPVLWRGGNARGAVLQAVRHFDGWCPFEVDVVGAGMTTTRESSIDTLPGSSTCCARSPSRRAGRPPSTSASCARRGAGCVRSPVPSTSWRGSSSSG